MIPAGQYDTGNRRDMSTSRQNSRERGKDMTRLFETHQIRKQTMLTGRLWDFTALEGEHAGKHIPVMTPGCWETLPGYENYRGLAEYTTTFEAEGDIRLEFKGVSHMAWIFVDGKEVASHYNAYTPFDAVVRGLAAGVHELKVKVDNSFKPEYALNRPNDYMSYGGISRAVVLEEISQVYVKNIHVTPLEPADGGWKARIQVFTENLTAADVTVALQIGLAGWNECSPERKAVPGTQMILDTVVTIPGVKSWMPDTPNLYLVKTALLIEGKKVDDLIDRIGFRTVSIQGNRVLMNGKSLRIKGFNRHEDHPQYGCALPLSAMAYDLALIRDMGGNSVRTSHYPNDELFLDLCDELGILVWEEHHLRGGSETMMRNPYFEIYAEQVIEEMITLHYNHPSIYIWGIMNECASDTEFGRTCYEKQYALIRRLDQSRVCSSASCRYEKDICMDLPDVVSWNMYPYWYERKTAEDMVNGLYNWTQNEGKGGGKPFLVTEIGAGALYGFRSHDRDPWTEEYQAECLEKQLTEVMNYQNCMGLYIWQFCDVRVNREWFDRRPRTRNNKGIVDEFRRHKLAYDVVKRLFGAVPDYWEEEN